MNSLFRFKRFLSSNSFVNRVSLLAGSTALGQGLLILASPIITRLYSPSDFGALAIYASFLGMLSVIVSLRYELAIPLPESNDVAANLLVVSLGLCAAISSLVALAVLLFGDSVLLLLKADALIPYVWLLPLGLCAVGLYQALNYWAIREKAFRRIAQTKLSQSLSSLSTQIGLGFMPWGPLGLLVGQVMGQAAGIVTLARRLNYRQMKAVVTLASLKSAASRYRRFPMYSSGSALMNSAGLLLPALFLSAFYGPQVAGWFALTERITRMPLNFIGQAVSQVFLSEASTLIHEDTGAFTRLFYSSTRNLLKLGLLMIVPLCLLAPFLFPIVFGQQWREAGVYVSLMGVALVAQFVVRPLSQVLYITEQQVTILFLDGLRMTTVVLAFALPNLLEYRADIAILAYSLSMAANYVLTWFISHRKLRGHSR